MRKVFQVCAILLAFSACSTTNSDTVVRAESLINSSAERISFPVTDKASMKAINNWLASGGTPTRAELSCKSDSKTCNSLKNSLKKHKVPFEVIDVDNTSASTISLLYDRLLATECKTGSFGCSTATNSVHMVSNREQFTKPASSGMKDAASILKAINKYIK